jgi:hypothetical protein
MRSLAAADADPWPLLLSSLRTWPRDMDDCTEEDADVSRRSPLAWLEPGRKHRDLSKRRNNVKYMFHAIAVNLPSMADVASACLDV